VLINVFRTSSEVNCLTLNDIISAKHNDIAPIFKTIFRNIFQNIYSLRFSPKLAAQLHNKIFLILLVLYFIDLWHQQQFNVWHYELLYLNKIQRTHYKLDDIYSCHNWTS